MRMCVHTSSSQSPAAVCRRGTHDIHPDIYTTYGILYNTRSKIHLIVQFIFSGHILNRTKTDRRNGKNGCRRNLGSSTLMKSLFEGVSSRLLCERKLKLYHKKKL